MKAFVELTTNILDNKKKHNTVLHFIKRLKQLEHLITNSINVLLNFSLTSKCVTFKNCYYPNMERQAFGCTY